MSLKDAMARLRQIKASGAEGLRTDLSWRYVQPQQGMPYDWQKFDTVMQANRQSEASLPITAILDYAPAWAGYGGCDGVQVRCAPADPNKFADFAVAAVQRYSRQGVDVYEIQNEENTGARSFPGPDSAAYVKLIEATCPRIKQADPNAFVVIGGLALGNKSGDIPMGQYTQQLYEEFAKNPRAGHCWDALGVHFYDASGATLAALNGVRDTMAAHHDDRPLWATEAGSRTNPSSGTCGQPGNPSDQQQAADLQRLIIDWRNYPRRDGVMDVFTSRDDAPGGQTFGLTCYSPSVANEIPKPSLGVFENFAQR